MYWDWPPRPESNFERGAVFRQIAVLALVAALAVAAGLSSGDYFR
jgi:hypothetical protein